MTISNKLNGAVIELDEAEFIEEFYRIREFGLAKLSSELAELLYAEDILVDEQRVASLLHDMDKALEKRAVFTFMPTENCNFRCAYCYEEHKSGRMNSDSIDSILNFCSVLFESGELDCADINWFGGEPLLEIDSVCKLNKYLVLKAKESDVIVRCGMTTNGYLLDIQNFKKLYDAGVNNFQITLDGFNHDKLRYLTDGSGSLDRILDNLKAMSRLDADYKYSVALRHNILAEDSDYGWYDFLYSLFGNDDRFCISIYSVKHHSRSSDELAYASDEGIVSKHRRYAVDIGFEDVTENKSPYGGICEASLKHCYVFRPDGSVVKCTVNLDESVNKIGIIRNGNVYIDDSINRLWYTIPPVKKCLSCRDFAVCMNRQCPLVRITGKCNGACL